MTSQEPGVAAIAGHTRDTAIRVLEHLQCGQREQPPVEDAPGPEQRGPKGPLPPSQVKQSVAVSNANAGSSSSVASTANNSGAVLSSLNVTGANNSGADSPSSVTSSTAGENSPPPTPPPRRITPAPTAGSSALNSNAGSSVSSAAGSNNSGSVVTGATAGANSPSSAAVAALGTPGEGSTYRPPTLQRGNVSGTARRQKTRVTYQNSRPSTSFPSPSAEQKQFADILQAARVAPKVQPVQINNNPNLRTTANAAAGSETESARRAREAREARLLNAGSAGAAASAAANAAEAERIRVLRQQKANAAKGQQFAANRAKDTRAANAANAAAAAERAKVVASFQSTGPSPLAAGLGQTASMAAKFNAMAKARAPAAAPAAATAVAVAAPATGERSFLQIQPPTKPLIGGRRTKKSKGRKNNRKSRRQQ